MKNNQQQSINKWWIKKLWLSIATTFLIAIIVLIQNDVIVKGHETNSSSIARSNLSPTPYPALPVYATESQPFDVVSKTLTIRMPLGTKKVIPLVITNTSTHTLTPVLYEAWPIPPLGVKLSASLDPSLQKVVLPLQSSRIDERILQQMADAPDGTADFLVLLKDQPDLSSAYHIADWSERGWYVYRTLVDHAERTQSNVRQWLESRGIPYQPLWIVNGLAVHGQQSDLNDLASREEVALLRANATASFGYDDITPMAISSCQADERGVCWNIRKIGADRVWRDFGISGQGITVAHIDSGVSFTNPALMQQYRGYINANQFYHSYNWYDAVSSYSQPMDAGSHGTHTMGTIVARGDGTGSQPAVGVAPGARWIAARGCGSSVCDETNLIEAAQWLLAPRDSNGNNPRPDLRPHIVNNSWASANGDETQFIDFTTTWRAAGIFPVFVVGNIAGSQACKTVVSPGDYAHVMGIGATDSNDTIASFSRFGPTKDGRIKPDLSAPGSNIASTYPGTGPTYSTLNGTSMAAPHVAGAVALLWSANPALIGDYDATYELLTKSATPIIDTRFDTTTFAACLANNVPNNMYGYGRINVYAAVAAANVDVPWLALPTDQSLQPLAPGQSETISLTVDMQQVAQAGDYTARILIGTGDLSQTPLSVRIEATTFISTTYATVSGKVVDENTNDPLLAQVSISDGPESLQVDSNGLFEITLPIPQQPYTYTFTAKATGYVSQSMVITLTAGMQRSLLFRLAFQNPQLSIDTTPIARTLEYGETFTQSIPISNSGTLPLNYELSVPSEWFGIWRSDEKNGPSFAWIALPTNSTAFTLTDDAQSADIPLGFSFPFGNKNFTSLHIGANGVIVFEGMKQTQHFIPSCGPAAETNSAALMPMRADLDPAQGGNIRYGNVGNAFVITYDQVPLHDKQDHIFTFQIILYPSGLIRFNYQNVAAIPNSAIVGIQFSKDQFQTIGCGETIPITNELSLELHSQPLSKLWVEVLGEPIKQTLQPGEAYTHQLILRWIANTHTMPYRGSIAIGSNDPKQKSILIPITLTTHPLRKEIALSTTNTRMLTLTNSLGLHIRLDIPPNTSPTTTTIVYTELPTPTLSPASMAYAGHAFNLSVYQDGQLVTHPVFNQPLVITMDYNDTTMTTYEEQNLNLFFLNRSTWDNAAVSPYVYDVVGNQIQVKINIVGDFGLFYDLGGLVYLPIVQRE